MSEFTLVMLPPQSATSRAWAERLARDVSGVRVVVADDEDEAREALPGAVAAYGAISPDLLAAAPALRWLQAPQAGPPAGFYHDDLVRHPVVVTNLRGTYTDHVATHAVALLLALARGLPRYAAQQARREWRSDESPESVLHLPAATVLVVGVGAVGAEIVRLLAPFGCTLVGTDARRTEPCPGLTELHAPHALDDLLPSADAVILTVPHTPDTERLIAGDRLRRFKRGALLVNVGRGALVDLGDLARALADRGLRGAAVDVVPEEPLDPSHPLWEAPGALITPHVAGVGPETDERRYGVLRENAERFAAGRPLINVVDKTSWF